MAPTAEFCGIDPEEMGRLATSLSGAANRLIAFSKEFEGKLGRYGVSTSALREIADIADWGGTQVSMLHGRIDLINALGQGAPELGGGGDGPSLVRLPDELAGFEAAQGLATMYGKDVFVNFEGEFQAALVHEHADEVAKLAENPQAAAAFFALLPAKIRDSLATRIARTGSKTAKQDLAAFSAALGAALRAPTLVPAFAKVRNDLVKPADKATAWNRLALVKGANAPSDVRSAAARSLALNDFAKDPRQDRRAAGPSETETYGYSSDLVAMGLEVLAGDGVAVRDAFAKMGGTDVKLSQVDKMKQFLDYAKVVDTGDAVADAFGRAMEAGTEATTEKAGQHSPAAAAFALDAIRAAGSFGSDLPTAAKDSMGVIAKSYVHELVSGGRFDKAADRTSGMEIPKHWEAFPGVTPAFYLSPGDTYGFMKTFVGEKKPSDEFDSTVARFRHDTLLAAARLDAQGKTDHFRDTSMMFGDFGSVGFKAAKDVIGEEDAVADLARDFTKNTAGFLLGGAPIVGQFAELGWDITQAYIVSSVSDKWADSFETQVEAATEKRSDLAKRLKYEMASLLHSGGYPASEPPKELVSTATGALKTYDELVAEAKREATDGKKWEQVLQGKLSVYEDWMDENENIDKKIEHSSRFQTSDLAENLLKPSS
ncbi:hypothetical protein [Streptosporangium sp. NBC_01756]|uniref:hypothetical protein n=1 Tax=Streptosporangium sp. NBC_01756 TaxID=2975950 RepID=UPI002DD7C1A4|nr:hypothetical protein [Streptosporangium sp. NBC_01756]WSC85221.1 hypothetical protein OIE48_33445 [Streptosporangium sp. NBC_01756]